MSRSRELERIREEVIGCELCPRLRSYCQQVAKSKRRAYRDWDYWGRPVPSFGDPQARLLIIGLAPGAHGANRTGRMFTGDSSGDFLYQVLFETGFSSQPLAHHRDDGLQLNDIYITAAARCAPPGNKPTREEFAACRLYLERELDVLRRLQLVVVLGRLALDAYLNILQARGQVRSRSAYPFCHGALYTLPPPLPKLLCAYHPSRQNTQTGVLTKPMLLSVFERARHLLTHP